ncbi:MAG: YabP/YqfC family sporulation protein [Clostridia bacterium]
MFIEEIIKTSGLDEINDGLNLKIFHLSNRLVCIEGFKKLIELTDEKIVVKYKKYNVVVTGKNLLIRNLTKGEIVITGYIFGVNYENI